MTIEKMTVMRVKKKALKIAFFLISIFVFYMVLFGGSTKGEIQGVPYSLPGCCV